MRKTIAIWTITAIAVAGAATTALAKPGDQYTLWAGGCLPGDTVNPMGSSFHCTEALSANPGGGPTVDPSLFKARRAVSKVPSATAKPIPVAKPALPAAPGR